MRELFFQVVPIILILLVFYAVLRVLFFKPLLKVIAEREARTIGAQKAATDKAKQYQDALKQARTEIYLEQEAARKKALDERAARLKEARTKTAIMVSSAKERIAAELLAAHREIEVGITPFAALVARRVLQSTRPPGATPRGSR